MGAALHMATCRTLIRTYAEQHPDEPELALAEANHRILADTHGGLFITVFYSVLDPVSGTMTFCNAGHNPPFLFSSINQREPLALTRTGMPLGILDETSWEQGHITFDIGDVLVAYTDGITEAQNTEEALLRKGAAGFSYPIPTWTVGSKHPGSYSKECPGICGGSAAV